MEPPERGAHLGLLPASTVDLLLGHCPSSGINPGDTPTSNSTPPSSNSLGRQLCIPTLSRSEFHSSSLKLAKSVKVKDLSAQPISRKFMRGHFSDKSESFSKVTKPRGGSAERFFCASSPPGFALSLTSREQNPEGRAPAASLKACCGQLSRSHAQAITTS